MIRLLLLAFAITILTLSGAVSSRAGETLLERGAYLMNGIVACGNCHNTRGPKGRFVEGMELAGGLVVAEELALRLNWPSASLTSVWTLG